VIDRITWLIGKVSGALMALASWAGAAIAGVYVLILCYGIWVAGDYLDWLRMRMEGRLDLVVGVRSIVNQALVTDATPIVPA
jgi:hypothetical protein